MKTVKIILIVVVILVIVIAALFAIAYAFLRAWFPPQVSKETMEAELVKNKAVITSVIDYLADLPYDSVSAVETDLNNNKKDTLYVSNGNYVGERIQIDDKNIAKNIEYLFKKCKYSNIDKSNNAIFFQRWTLFRDGGTGIAYSIDGHSPEAALQYSLQCLTKLEPLGEENWYYYEAFFKEWKERNNQ